MRKPILWFLSLVIAAFPVLGSAAPFAIAVSGPLEAADVTTHEITSGGAVLGVSDKGGGYINKLVLPGIGDIIGPVAGRFGRGGQVDIRDELHGRRYNPTQAGFSDRAGTHVQILLRDNKIVMPRRAASLWHGDRQFDFTEWENLASDGYPKGIGNSDEDNIDESALAGKQADEITSEFDFVGSYSNAFDRVKVRIPAFRFQYEMRYARKPGHAMRQFGRNTRIFAPTAALADISVEAPPGVHPATEGTLSQLITTVTLRGDKSVWNPTVVFTLDPQSRLVVGRPGRADDEEVQSSTGSLVILATGTDINVGPAIGFFQPANRANTFNVVGRSTADHAVKYEDRRSTRVQLLGTPTRAAGMWLMGTRVHSTGLLSPTETPKGVYEAVRGESFILIGSPREILEASVQLAH